MTRDELVETMAREMFAWRDPQNGVMHWGIERTRLRARPILTSLCRALPGLSDVLDGKAVIVPVEASDPELFSLINEDIRSGE